MLRILRQFNSRPDIAQSRLFSESNFKRQFVEDLKRANKVVTIESPYLTVRQIRSYAPLFRQLTGRRVRIRINTRQFSHHNWAMEQQARQAAKLLLDSGVDLYVYNDLRHWKLAMIDRQILWEGSLNILSHNLSREVMRRTDSSWMCQNMIKFIRL